MIIGQTNPHMFQTLSDIFVDADDYMYFRGTDNTLWRSKTDGTNVSNPNGFTTKSNIFVANGYMYFRGTDDTLWCSRTDGTDVSNPNGFKTWSDIFVDADDYMYFRGTDNTLWRSKTDGTNVSNPNGFKTKSNIFVANGYMYFRGIDDKLWRSKSDGTNLTNPNGFTTYSDIFVDGAGYMYFRGADDTLWRSKTDGTDVSNPNRFKTLSNIYVDAKGYMYFRGTDDRLWRSNSNGLDPTAGDTNPNGFTTHSDVFVDVDDYMYFRGTDNTLWRSKTDGTNVSNPNGFTTKSNIFVANGYMYFRGTDDTLWCSRTDGTDVSNPNGFKSWSDIFVDADDYMYFRGTDNTLWRSKTDGTNVSNPNGFKTKSNIFVANGYMYFRGIDDKLWRSKTDGTEAINPKGFTTQSDIFVVDYYMYFRGTDNTLWCLLKADLNQQNDWSNPGDHKTVSNVFVDPEGYMYFCGTDNRVLRARTDGTDLSNPNGFKTVSNISVDKAGYMYFRGTDDKLWRSKICECSTLSNVFVDTDGSMYFRGTDNLVRKYDFREGKLIDFTAAAIVQLQRWYEWSRGQWRDDWNKPQDEWEVKGWWQSANALNALIDFMRITRARAYEDVVANTFDKVLLRRRNGFLNDFFDDEGWWALALINAYELTKEPRFLDSAKLIFSDMTTGWDETTHAGGIWWKKDRQLKNAIANELFVAIAARLYLRTGTQMFLDWALRTWNWFDKSGLVNSQHLIINGFEQWPPTWTYIQGVILGALCDISTITGEITYRMRAQTIADSVLSSSSGLVRSDGILQEFKTEEDPSIYYQDGYQFKGIFIRNLAYLFESTNDPKYKDFIETNVRAVLKSRNSFNQYGKSWYARLYKDDHPDFARQTSAIDCLNAALTVLGPTWAP